jgi:chemotaxis response regulator CheB
MPKAAIERGYAQRVVSLEMLANTLTAQCALPKPKAKHAVSVSPE